nr:MAG TPA: hypothetical protein [Caudoviricetes sp.]
MHYFSTIIDHFLYILRKIIQLCILYFDYCCHDFINSLNISFRELTSSLKALFSASYLCLS